uniref:Hybrid signal transduction histidine kinase M-like n=1 Tax=Dermatophagoides pteronyssinus TaxID=6956 RepID=A0A6P6Y9A8_DERPT|nr:hybrid signal transduction histidine kinase M-like [Dermatophagoides pteronyssinus]
MASSSSSSMDLLSSMIWSPYHAIQQAVLPFYHRSSGPISIIDLNNDCLWTIYSFLDFDDLVRCRRVCHRFLSTIDDYLKLMKNFVYDCHLNGLQLRHGQYQFDIRSFEFWLEHMPSIQRIRFEQCRIMRNALTHCQFNLFDSISALVTDLKELHLGRALFINQHSLSQLIHAFPSLTHLTITIYDEHLLSQIISGFQQLYYLNLDESILYNFSSALRNLPSSIRVLIPPVDLKNEKSQVLKSICDGHGINLERLEIRATIHNLFDDRHYFDMIGQMLVKLQWLQLDLSCAAIFHPQLALDGHQQQEINNNDHEYGQNNHHPHDYEPNSDECLNLISGLHHLVNLRVLILKEKDYFDENHNDDHEDDGFLTINQSQQYRSLFDDFSLLKIFKNCSKLIMLSISSSLCCNRRDYAHYTMNRKQDDYTINRILNRCFSQLQKQQIIDEDGNNCDCDIPINHSSHHMNNNKNVYDSNDNNNYSNIIVSSKLSPTSISDHSLSTLNQYLPDLRILRLRGVCIGQRSLLAIQNLKRLQFLRLDSIRFNRQEKSSIKESFSELMQTLTSDMYQSNEHCKQHRQHRTSIHLTNIPMI